MFGYPLITHYLLAGNLSAAAAASVAALKNHLPAMSPGDKTLKGTSMAEKETPDLDNPSRIDCPAISDLWFNHDHSECKIIIGGQFAGYDIGNLMDEAQAFRSTLTLAGLSSVPSAKELVEDFYARM